MKLTTRQTLLASALFIGAAGIPTAAFAQDSQPECGPDQQNAGNCVPRASNTSNEQSVTVTGTRIRSPNLQSQVPITSISGETFFQSGDTNVGQTLNDLPQLRSTFAQQNPGLGIGIAGLNLLDLRGLGTQRTLVLVNGRRHVPADILNNAVSPDINTIPNDLIERVDIVTGGEAAIYGSDAIAGVVNFILRRDYDGLQVRGQAGVAGAGFGGNQYASIMFGRNFNDGRGNITLHGEYAHQERVFASDVPWFRQNNGFFTTDLDVGGLPNGSDGFPDASFIRDVRSATINPNGLIAVPQQTTNAACGRGTVATNGGPVSTGVPYNCTFIFLGNGQLVPQTGSRFGSGPTGSIVGGNGQTGREGRTVSILPFQERYNFNLLSHYTFTDAAEVFLEAKWNRVNALGNNAGPSFIQTATGNTGNIGDFRERPRLDNPFLGTANRTTLTNAILAAGCNVSLTAGCPVGGNLTAADLAAIADGSYRFQLARNLLDVGLRDERFQRDTYRIVGGLRGTFNDDWSYELSVNYGKFQEDVTTNGFIDRQRFSLSMDAGRNPVTGQIQCRSQFDPTAAVPIQRAGSGDPARNAARLAADIAACVPYNPFGAPNNDAAVNYFAREFTAHDSLDQLVVSGFVSGDSSQLFELPGGPIGFAIGAEYRRENASYEQDPFVTDGFTNGVSIPSFEPDTFEVKEAYGELRLPLLRDIPFIRELTANGAARVAEYQGGVGTVWAYNAGLEWSPIRDIRFRGNYSRAVRAPNVSETAFPLVPNFAPGFQDPCNPNNINANTNRTNNCQADLGSLLGNLPAITYSLPIVSGSNPNLKAETSDSWTFGAVIQPRFIPGLAITADYYNIRVNGIITSVGAQGIVNSCYDLPSLNNVFCQQFTRFRGPGTGPNGEAPGAILGNSLINAPLNFASRVRRGIDVNVTYRTNITQDVRLDANLIYVHNFQISNFESATNPDFENRILGEIGDPRNEFRLDTDISYKDFTFGYRLHYIGPMFIGAAENVRTVNGVPPQNLDAFVPTHYPAITYSDLRFEWNIRNGVGFARSLKFYFGVDNVFNRIPPLGTTATGAGTAIYDFEGRTFYGGFRAQF